MFCQKKTLIVLSSTALKFFFQSLLEVFQFFSSAFTKSVRGRKFNKEKKKPFCEENSMMMMKTLLPTMKSLKLLLNHRMM